MSLSTSVLLPEGRKVHFSQRAYESKDEYRGRLLCEIEDEIRGRRAPGEPLPKGTRWAQWEHDGHDLRKFSTHAFGTVKEATGVPYADRFRILPGRFDLDAARAALGAKGGSAANPHVGSDFDDFLAAEGILEEAETAAREKLTALSAAEDDGGETPGGGA